MYTFIVRGLLIGVFCIPAVATAADSYDTCKDLSEKAIIHCLRMVYEMNTSDQSSPAPSGRSIFSEVMSKDSSGRTALDREQLQLQREQLEKQVEREQMERQRDREAAREAAALQALGMALSGGGPIRYAPVYQPPVMLPLQGYNLAPRPRMNCLSQQYGNQTMTNCQ